jgi:hypothetical protein
VVDFRTAEGELPVQYVCESSSGFLLNSCERNGDRGQHRSRRREMKALGPLAVAEQDILARSTAPHRTRSNRACSGDAPRFARRQRPSPFQSARDKISCTGRLDGEWLVADSTNIHPGGLEGRAARRYAPLLRAGSEATREPAEGFHLTITRSVTTSVNTVAESLPPPTVTHTPCTVRSRRVKRGRESLYDTLERGQRIRVETPKSRHVSPRYRSTGPTTERSVAAARNCLYFTPL